VWFAQGCDTQKKRRKEMTSSIHVMADNTRKTATKVAIVVTALIYATAFLFHWRTHVLFVMDRIVGAFELLAGLVGLIFGFALVSVVLRAVIIAVFDFGFWILHHRQRGARRDEETPPT
jgi:uncharacterized membrane protein